MKQGGYQYQSDFAKRYIALGREEGRVAGEALALLLVLEARGFAIDAATRARVEGCEDPVVLQRWIRTAATATALDDVFA